MADVVEIGVSVGSQAGAAPTIQVGPGESS